MPWWFCPGALCRFVCPAMQLVQAFGVSAVVQESHPAVQLPQLFVWGGTLEPVGATQTFPPPGPQPQFPAFGPSAPATQERHSLALGPLQDWQVGSQVWSQSPNTEVP